MPAAPARPSTASPRRGSMAAMWAELVLVRQLETHLAGDEEGAALVAELRDLLGWGPNQARR